MAGWDRANLCISLDVALRPNDQVMMVTVTKTSITLSWPSPENVNFLTSYLLSYTSTPISTSKRRRRQSPSMNNITLSATMNSVDLMNFQPYSTYMVDVSAVYAPPNSVDPVKVLLIPTTPIITPQRSEELTLITCVHALHVYVCLMMYMWLIYDHTHTQHIHSYTSHPQPLVHQLSVQQSDKLVFEHLS